MDLSSLPLTFENQKRVANEILTSVADSLPAPEDVPLEFVPKLSSFLKSPSFAHFQELVPNSSQVFLSTVRTWCENYVKTGNVPLLITVELADVCTESIPKEIVLKSLDSQQILLSCSALEILLSKYDLSQSDVPFITRFLSSSFDTSLKQGNRQNASILCQISLKTLDSKLLTPENKLFIDLWPNLSLLCPESNLQETGVTILYHLFPYFTNPQSVKILCDFLSYKDSAFVRKSALATLRIATGDKDFWSDFALLFETLEQPQAHLVEPVLHKLKVLIGSLNVTSGLKFTVDFLRVIFNRAFSHPNSWLRLWALQEFLEIEPGILKDSVEMLFVDFVPVWNNADLILQLVEQKKMDGILEKLEKLFAFWGSEVDDFWGLWLRNLMETDFLAGPLLYWTFAASKIEGKKWSKRDLISMRSVISGLSKLPVPYLRAAIETKIMEIFITGTEWNYKDSFFDLASLLPEAKFLDNSVFDFAVSELGDTVCLDHVLDADWPTDFGHARVVAQLFWKLFNSERQRIIVGEKLGALIGNFSQRPYLDVENVQKYMLLCSFDIAGPFDLAVNYAKHLIFINKFTLSDLETVDQIYLPLIKSGPSDNFVKSCVRKFKASDSLENKVILLHILGSFANKHLSALVFRKNYLQAFDLNATVRQIYISDHRRIWLHFPKVFPMSLESCIEALDTVSDIDHLTVLFRVFQRILSQELDTVSISSTLCALWSCVCEFKRSEHYHNLISQLLKIVFQTPVLRCPKSLELANSLLSQAENSPNIAFLLSKAAKDAFSKVEILDGFEIWTEFLLELCIFGPIPSNNQKLYSEAAEFSIKNAFKVSIPSLHQAAQETRVLALATVIDCIKSNKITAEILLQSCMDRIDKLLQERSRSFALNPSHRVRTRLLQLILMLTGDSEFLSCQTAELIFNWCVGALSDSAQQSSVRILTEFILSRLCIRFETVRNVMLILDKELCKKRIGSVCSWVTVLLHTAQYSGDTTFRLNAFKKVLPWTSAQNFPARCTALAALRILLEQFEDLKTEFQMVLPIIYFDFEATGNSKRVIDNLCSDFFFSILNPVTDFTFETIFEAIPLRTGLPAEEQLKTGLATRYWRTKNSVFSVSNSNPKLLKAHYALWKATPNSTDSNPANSLDQNCFQKKLAPISREKSSNPQKNGRLIVVASLINRATNLGGLCRTCEIFAATQFVVSNAQVVKEQDFKNLSVSAENWIDIKEVKPYHLRDFLTKLKSQGYKIVGAEQTTDSVPLDKFEFPANSVLLLGNEKEGISLDLIHLLDCVVEIGQFGIIRSLNVHVSGALLIYEYAKQHR